MKITISDLFSVIDHNLPAVYGVMTGKTEELKLAINYMFTKHLVFRKCVHKVELWVTHIDGREVFIGDVEMHTEDIRYGVVSETMACVKDLKIAMCRYLLVPYLYHLKSNESVYGKFFMENLQEHCKALYGVEDMDTINEHIRAIVQRWGSALRGDRFQQAIGFIITQERMAVPE